MKTSKWPAQDRVTFPDHCQYDCVVEERRAVILRGEVKAYACLTKDSFTSSQRTNHNTLLRTYLDLLEVDLNSKIIFRRCDHNITSTIVLH